jgi:hypothetical protein
MVTSSSEKNNSKSPAQSYSRIEFIFGSSYLPNFSFPTPCCPLRKASKGVMESNIPPTLAAQSAFPSGPLPGFHKKFDQLIWK